MIASIKQKIVLSLLFLACLSACKEENDPTVDCAQILEQFERELDIARSNQEAREAIILRYQANYPSCL